MNARPHPKLDRALAIVAAHDAAPLTVLISPDPPPAGTVLTKRGPSKDPHYQALLADAAAVGISPATVRRARWILRHPDAGSPPDGISLHVRALRARDARLRVMAAEGYTSRQMAPAARLTLPGCRKLLRRLGIDVPADRLVGKSRRHRADRIVEHMAQDAENLTADLALIHFADLDPTRLDTWLATFKAARTHLDGFIHRLQQKRNTYADQAHHVAPQSPAGPRQGHADPAGRPHPTPV